MYSVCMYITENKYRRIKLIFLIRSVIIIILMILINTLGHSMYNVHFYKGNVFKESLQQKKTCTFLLTTNVVYT